MFNEYSIALFYTFSLDYIFKNIDKSNSAVAIFGKDGIVASNLGMDSNQFKELFPAERVLEINESTLIFD